MDALWEIPHKVAAFIYPAQSWPRALFSLSPAARPALCLLPSPQPGADPLLWHLPSLWPEESLAACDKSEGNPPCLSLTPAFASQFLESPFCISLTSFFCPASWTPRALEELRCPALQLSWPRTEGGFHSAAGRAGFCLRPTLLPICLKPCCFLTAVSNMFLVFFPLLEYSLCRSSRLFKVSNASVLFH